VNSREAQMLAAGIPSVLIWGFATFCYYTFGNTVAAIVTVALLLLGAFYAWYYMHDVVEYFRLKVGE
jgi:hypothetical protein